MCFPSFFLVTSYPVFRDLIVFFSVVNTRMNTFKAKVDVRLVYVYVRFFGFFIFVRYAQTNPREVTKIRKPKKSSNQTPSGLFFVLQISPRLLTMMGLEKV